MNNVLNTLTLSDFTHYALIGFGLALLHLFLLWQTITLLTKSKKKGFVLFLSSVLRIFLLVFIALACSKQNMGHFLIIMCSFFLTRIFLLKLFHPSLKKKLKNSEVITQERKRDPYSNMVSTKRRTVKTITPKRRRRKTY